MMTFVRQLSLSVMAILLIILCIQPAQAQQYDLLILNGHIVDGTGNAWYPGDLAVKDGKIAKIGNLSRATAARTIDATDHVISPGFIDIHSHGDRGILRTPRAENYVRQGITTFVGGNCGNSAAPSDDFPDYPALIKYMEDGGLAINVVLLVGHGNLRRAVVGEAGRLLSNSELDEMKQILDQCLRDGASGMSTGLGYAPGIFSDTDELVALAEVLAEHDALYATHIRGDASTWRSGIEEGIEICRRSGAALQLSHMEAHYPNWGAQEMCFRLIDEARARGLDVTCDVPPFVRGGTGLHTMLPDEALDGGAETIIAYLTDPEKRAFCKRHVYEDKANHNTPVPTLIADGYADNIFIDGISLGEIARRRELDPAEAAFDILIENGGKKGTVLQHHNEADLIKIVGYPMAMIETDGGIQVYGEGLPNPRSYGAFPIVFRKYVRGETRPEAPEDPGTKIISLEEAVRKMTSFPAQKMGMWDRGMIRENMIADLVVFNPDTISEKCTYLNPHQYPVGIPYVIIDGVIVVDDNVQNDSMPGMVLRSTRSR
jgi:N-acyl-D-amino-acid deacylase